MYGKRGRELRRCQAITLNGYGQQCRNFSKVGSNLCSIHFAADDRKYPDEATKVYNKVVSKKNRIGKKKTHYLRCSCKAYPFVHPASGGICQWPFQPDRRLECKTDVEAVALRQKLRRKGLTVNTIKEKMESGIGADSRIVDIDDFDPNDLSLEEEYLSKVQYEVDVLSLPIDERRKIQKQKMITEYLLKTAKVTLVAATVDDTANTAKDVAEDMVKNDLTLEEVLREPLPDVKLPLKGDADVAYIDGDFYRLK